MSKMLINMALGSAVTITAAVFLCSKDGKKIRCKIAKIMN